MLKRTCLKTDSVRFKYTRGKQGLVLLRLKSILNKKLKIFKKMLAF